MQTELFPEAPVTPAYVGWFRPADGAAPWEPVCSAGSYEECLWLLLRHKPAAVPRCEKVVKPRGVKP